MISECWALWLLEILSFCSTSPQFSLLKKKKKDRIDTYTNMKDLDGVL